MDDSAYLDWVFDEALARIEDGRGFAAEEFLGSGREHLRADVESVLDEARAVAVVRPDPRPPALRGYTIVSRLGRGAMGSVYLARQDRLGGRAVALKFLPPSAALSPKARERFKAEANAVARLRHPNIVAVHDVIEEGGVHAFAMEWVEGRSLAQLIDHLASRGGDPAGPEIGRFLGAAEGTIEVESYAAFVCRVGISIARALAAVHAAGLLHRDVKPSNVLLRKDGTALLSDFGLVRDALPGDSTFDTRSGQFVGTPAYAAPEQLRGERSSLGPRSDVYSLGATLYHALALRPPCSAGSTVSILREVETGRVAPLRRVSPHLSIDLSTIVGNAMDPEPERRYATANDLADDLERLLRLEPIRARPAGWVTRTAKFIRRRRGVLIAAAVASAASLAVAAALVAMVFLRPRWVDARVTAARMALLDPARGNDVFVAAVEPGRRSRGSVPPRSALRSALESYDAALRLAPGNEEIALEREAVRRALDPDGDGPDPSRAGDPRARGLFSYLRGEHADALSAWTELEAREPPGPFVEAALGILHLARNEPALAYPRLAAAAEAFPDVGFLAVYHADAALRCGDVALAERILENARGLRDLDPLGALERVEADLDAARGRDDRARARYEGLVRRSDNVVALVHFARFLESRGEFARALELNVAVASGRGFREPHVAECVAAAERCFGSLSRVERWGFLRRALDDAGAEDASFLGQLAAIEFPPVARDSAALTAFDSSPPRRRAELSVLAQAMQEVDMSANRVRAYPGWTKTLLAGALVSDDPLPSALLVDRVWRRWRLVLGLVAAAIAGGPATASAQTSFHGLGSLPGGSTDCSSFEISSDGSTIVGSGTVAGGSDSFRWRADTGLWILGDLPGGGHVSGATSMTPDGSVVVGFSETVTVDHNYNHTEGYTWSEETGLIGRGALPDGSFDGQFWAITSDGGRVFGNSNSSYGTAAVRWTAAGGWVDLGFPSTRARVNDATPDGSTLAITEWASGPNRAFRWTAEVGFESLGDLPGGGIDAQPWGISADGGVIVGVGTSGSGSEAFAYTEGSGMVGLGDFPDGTFYSYAWEVSPDGSLIVGFGTTALGREAAIWDAAAPIARVADYLADCGVDIPPGWTLQEARAIADDKLTTTLTGTGINPLGDSEAWVASFPSRSSLGLRAGNVNTGAGGPAVDVMFLNGSTGDPVERRVTVASGVPATLHIAKAPSTPGPRGGYGYWIFDGDLRGCEDVRIQKSSGEIVLLGQANACMPVNNSVAAGSCPCPLTFPLGKTAGTMSAPKAALFCLEQPASPKSPTDFMITFPAGTFTILSVHLDRNAPASPAKNIAIGNTIVVVAE